MYLNSSSLIVWSPLHLSTFTWSSKYVWVLPVKLFVHDFWDGRERHGFWLYCQGIGRHLVASLNLWSRPTAKNMGSTKGNCRSRNDQRHCRFPIQVVTSRNQSFSLCREMFELQWLVIGFTGKGKCGKGGKGKGKCSLAQAGVVPPTARLGSLQHSSLPHSLTPGGRTFRISLTLMEQARIQWNSRCWSWKSWMRLGRAWLLNFCFPLPPLPLLPLPAKVAKAKDLPLPLPWCLNSMPLLGHLLAWFSSTSNFGEDGVWAITLFVMLPSSLLHFASFFTDSRISKSGWKMLEIILVSFAGWNRYERMNAVLAAASRRPRRIDSVKAHTASCKNKTHQLRANSKHLDSS